MTEVDFSDVDEAELSAQLDAVADVLARLDKLDTTTRMEVLAVAYPNLYTRLAAVYQLSKSLFEDA